MIIMIITLCVPLYAFHSMRSTVCVVYNTNAASKLVPTCTY